MTVIPHLPNSSDLAACDFWLFDLIKQNLDGLGDSYTFYESVTKFIKSSKTEEYKKTFDKWTERMKLFINSQGDYFEPWL